jgi:vacuolar-type H+-ATPase subunit I/STV1
MDTEGYYDDSVGGFVYTSKAISDKLARLMDSRCAVIAEEWAIQEQIDQLQRQLEAEQDPMAEMTLASQIGELNEAIDEKEIEVEKIDKKISDFENLALSASIKDMDNEQI